MSENQDVFTWLSANGYADVADKIRARKQKWAEQGIKTRRNWWEVLSGDKDGKPRVIDNVEFPVLAAAQKRQGKPVTPNALQLNDGEEAPGIKQNTRWSKRGEAKVDAESGPVEAATQEPPPAENQPVNAQIVESAE